MARKLLVGTAGLILVITVVALGPALLRRDIVRYRWGGSIGEGTLVDPIGIAYSQGRLFVSDAATNRIVVLDTAGSVVAVWGDSALGLVRPMHLSLGPHRSLHVAEYLTDRVSIVDSAGQVIGRIGGATGSQVGELDAPGGVAATGQAVFVADFYNHRVQAFEGGTARVIGRPGRLLPGRMHYPTDVAADDSLVYVADAYNHRVQVFRASGAYVRRWGGPLGLGLPGPFRGWFRVATGIDVAQGRVYVADFFNNRVQVFSDRGRYLGQAGDSLERPTDVSVGPDGELFIVDFGHKRVVRLVPLDS